MALLLGLDTGGTFTDAALLETGDEKAKVIAKAKSLTTRHDLAIGLAGAAQKAIDISGRQASEIGLVSLSTTLATNALVEGQGNRVALIAIGFEQRDLENAGLADALGSDPVIHLTGGHTTHGMQAKELDLTPLETQIDNLAATVSGFAVAGYFAVRNPAHELAVRDYILERTGKAVTCSHELSAKLNGPKRALTTVLNARLVPMITRLITATRRMLDDAGVNAPVMVVRGDGALVSADFAARRPIETILSGPAASLVGARYLTDTDNAFVCDIGGTTSDVAVLENGTPKIDEHGAMVGGFRTMVQAVAMHTFGLGGDSEIETGGSALRPELTLGPRRLVPVSLTASNHSEIVHEALDRQLKSTLNGRYDGRFAFLSGIGTNAGLTDSEKRLYDRLDEHAVALDTILESNAQAAAISRLVRRGLVMVSGLTPSDAMHALGRNDIWDTDAALKAVKLFARRRDGSGKALSDDPLELAQRIVARVQRQSAEVVLETAWTLDGRNGANLLNHELTMDMLNARQHNLEETGHVRNSIALTSPLIGLGASAFQYHPEAARLLQTEVIVPDHADVANAIGAVVGHISMRAEVSVSQPSDGRFAVTGMKQVFTTEESAFQAAEIQVREKADKLAREAGADDITITVNRDIKRANLEGRDTLIQGILAAIATGRPPLVG